MMKQVGTLLFYLLAILLTGAVIAFYTWFYATFMALAGAME